MSLFGTGQLHGPRHILEQHGGQGEGPGGKLLDARGRAVFLRLCAFLGPYRARMAAACGLMLFSTGLTVLIPWLIKTAIDRDIAGADSAGLLVTGMWILLAYIGEFLAAWGQRFLLSWVGQRLLFSLRNRLFRHLQELPLAWHGRHITGVTVSKVIGDVAVINELLSQGLVTVAGDLLILGGIVAAMLSMNTRLALLAFGVLPLMAGVTWLFSRRARGAFRRTRTAIARLIGCLAENLGGMRVIQAFHREELTREEFDRLSRENRDAHIAAMSLSFIFIPVVELLGVLAMAVVLLAGGPAVGRGTLTLGLVVAFISYVSRFFQPIQELSQLYTTLQAALAGGERVLELLDTRPAVSDRPEAQEMPPLRGRIELREVHFSYTPGVEVLRGVSLVVEPGRTVALVGPTGAGKTTIINLIPRFHDPGSGAVLIDGIDVREVAQRSLRRRLGIVGQEPFLFTGTVRENIRFGRPERRAAEDGAAAGEDEVVRAARLARAHDFVSRLPDGYDTRILEGGVNLSMGQRQLLAIARAIFADPAILLLDEATSSVDTLTEALIQEGLRELFRGRTSLVIAHRLSTVREADCICVVQDGRITEQGTHSQLLRAGGLYRLLYERQFRAES